MSNKQEEGQQMFEYKEGDDNQPQIGTEILDPSLPSDLNFSPEKKKELEGEQVDNGYKYVKGKSSKMAGDEIKTFTIKGKSRQPLKQKYKCASIVHESLVTFQVKALDEDRSGGWKSLWESIVGYVKRQICIEDGYIYIFEATKDGYMTHGAYSLNDLFKVFTDPEESKIRLVFREEGQDRLKTKNFGVKNCQDIMDKIKQEASVVGLTVISD